MTALSAAAGDDHLALVQTLFVEKLSPTTGGPYSPF